MAWKGHPFSLALAVHNSPLQDRFPAAAKKKKERFPIYHTKCYSANLRGSFSSVSRYSAACPISERAIESDGLEVYTAPTLFKLDLSSVSYL